MVIIMNKKNLIILLVIIVILIAFGIFFFMINNRNEESQNGNYSSYETNRTSANSDTNQNNSNSTNDNPSSSQIVEEQISTFATKIYNPDPARQNNIAITCSRLNGTIVKNNETFSFCNTLGPSSTNMGYQEADIFDRDGNKKKGLGGGNCQISSTLYNAVLAVPSLQVTERHAHSNYVPYIQKGKDAAVAYGSYDFKFVNQTGNDIKLNFQSSASDVTVSIVSLKVQ